MTVGLEDDRDASASFWAHLPGILLEEGVTCDIGPATIASLDFETWHALDGEYWEPVNYRDTSPIFLKGAIRRGDKSEEVIDSVRQLVSNVYHALLLASRLPLPPPNMSCTYIPDYSLVLAGACGREWIIGGYWKPIRFKLDSAKLSEANLIYSLLVETMELWEETEIEAAINILDLSAYPDVTIAGNRINWMNQFVHCLSAVERLLIPDEARNGKPLNITSTLGRNAALLEGCAFESIQESAKTYSDLYRLRSRILHGELGAHNITGNEEKLIYGRYLLCTLIVKAIALLRESKEPLSLTEILEQASQDAASHGALLKKIELGLKG
jgi:hypothetical protein